jgi:hypothetical protein
MSLAVMRARVSWMAISMDPARAEVTIVGIRNKGVCAVRKEIVDEVGARCRYSVVKWSPALEVSFCDQRRYEGLCHGYEGVISVIFTRAASNKVMEGIVTVLIGGEMSRAVSAEQRNYVGTVGSRS